MDELEQRVVEAVDGNSAVQLAIDLTNIPSPTGHERAVAEFLYEKFTEMGLKTRLQEISPGRFNTIGVLEGTGEGLNLLFDGHMDTSYTGQETELTGSGYKNKATIVDKDWIFGNGVFNMKGGLAAAIGAVDALRRAEIKLKGDVIIAAVAGEIEKAPIDEYQGIDYAGYGAGTEYMLCHGVFADACILPEPTAFQVIRGLMGTCWVKISTLGTVGHTAHMDWTISSIDKMMRVIDGLKGWIANYRERYQFNGVRPNVNIAAMRGGWPWRAARTPVRCDLYVDVRFTPDIRPTEICHELKEMLRTLAASDPDLKTEIEFYTSNPPSEIPEDSDVLQIVLKAHERIMGDRPVVTVANYYSDAAHPNRYGIPAVTYGPGGRLRGGGVWNAAAGEHINIPDLISGTKILALAAFDFCSRPRLPRRG